MATFAEKAIQFHRDLVLQTSLPLGIKPLNPFANNSEVELILKEFYTKYYNDHKTRQLILGINPGRLGAGSTGIPFTDPKRLQSKCGIDFSGKITHEPSSVFVYKVIEAYGDVRNFYSDFYIDSVCPLGFIRQNKKGNWINCNYYDYQSLYKALKPFIITHLKAQIEMGIDTSVCYSLGIKNARFLDEINQETKLFDKIVALPHPRYVIQYKFKEMDRYIKEYVENLKS